MENFSNMVKLKFWKCETFKLDKCVEYEKIEKKNFKTNQSSQRWHNIKKNISDLVIVFFF